jgi:hypothetical protein
MFKDFEKEVKEAIKKEPSLELPKEAAGTSPPVFVKVERYKDLLGDIQQLRSYSLGMRDALDAMSEIEKELKTAMNLTNKVLDKLNMIISSLDMKLLKKSGPVMPPMAGDEGVSVKPPAEVEGHIKEIYEQIERLKGELHSIS